MQLHIAGIGGSFAEECRRPDEDGTDSGGTEADGGKSVAVQISTLKISSFRQFEGVLTQL